MKRSSLGLLVMIAFFSSASAQTWTAVQTFPGYVSFVKFTGDHTAFVGLGVGPGGPIHGPVGIWRSTDLGEHWTECQIPSDYSGEVTDVLMTDSLNGWASVIPYLSNGRDGLWRTSDGGQQWVESGFTGACTSIRITPSAIVATDIFGPRHVSTDGGNTFTSGIDNSSNCVDFVDAKHGVSSTYRGKNWEITSDGGLSWQPSNEVVESWSVYGVQGTSTFYAAPEGPTDGSPYTSVVLQSTDYGMNWNVQSTLPFVTTGTIVGVNDDELYLQVSNNGNHDSLRDGIFRSTDKGVTWTDLGGPGALSDSRLAVLSGCAGSAVFAFDAAAHGTLYRLGLPGNAAYYSPYFSGFYRPQISTDLPIPLSVRLPNSLNAGSRNVRRVAYRITIDSAAAIIAGVTPATGWQLTAFAPQTNGVDVTVSKISPGPVSDSLFLGTVTLHAKQPGLTPLKTDNFRIDIDSESVALCLAAEGNISALINADENSGVEADAAAKLCIHVRGTDQVLWSELTDGPIELQLVDEAGRVVDARRFTASGGELQYAPVTLASGAYLVILRQADRYELQKLLIH